MKMYLILFVALLFAISGCAGTNKAGENPVERMVDDSTITTRINHEMVKDDVVKARQIDIDTESTRAVQIARGVAGVLSVSNNLQIGERSYGDILDDNLISNKIKAKLIAEPEVRSLNIDVDVYLGVVTLSGVVGSKYQKERAIALSRSTNGTVKVVDNLKVQ
jgi:hyperosmotically inducible protein